MLYPALQGKDCVQKLVIFQPTWKNLQYYPPLVKFAEAMRLALARAKPGDLICAAGSVFVIAEVMEEMGGGNGY